MKRILTFSALLLLIIAATAKEYLRDDFNSFPNGWVTSTSSTGKTLGRFELSAGEFYANPENKGLKTSENSRHYAIAKNFDTSFVNQGKTLVLQYSVKNEQGIDCGGQYIKVGNTDELQELDQFNANTPYSIMFGPDICGSTNKVHIILKHNGKNYEWKKTLASPKDKLTHLYTLIINPDNTYEVQIDGLKRESGNLEADWDLLPPKTIPDPEDKKPEDWVDEPKMVDPDDKKPEDWDNEPQFISDPDAVKPDEWDDEEDGTWEAPEIPNPEYKGEWTPRLIDNPAYKGVWTQKQIPNPDYVADPNLHSCGELNWVGIEVWQVKAGTIFDNLLVTDSVDEAKKAAQSVLSDAKIEKEKFDAAEEIKKKAEEEDRKRRAEEERKRMEEESKKKEEEAAAEQAEKEAVREEATKEGEKSEHDEL